MIDIDKLNLSNKNKEILSSYLRYLITVKFLKKETTVNSYILDIYKYLEYIDKDYDESDNDDIYNYLKYLDKERYSIYSVVRKISSIKSFYTYLATEEIYQMLPIKDSESIMISEYPVYDKKLVCDESIIDEALRK